MEKKQKNRKKFLMKLMKWIGFGVIIIFLLRKLIGKYNSNNDFFEDASWNFKSTRNKMLKK